MKPTNLKSKPVRVLFWTMLILGELVVTSCTSKSSPTSQNTSIPASDTPSETQDDPNAQLSDKGLFKVSYTVSTGKIPVNQMHQWTLHVETADGLFVEDAAISVDGDMPEHGHGLPTQPRVTKYLGHGNYLVEGMKFQMGGFWIMDFTITVNELTDTVHFEMQLK